jgi:tryptophan-rich sensory protein
MCLERLLTTGTDLGKGSMDVRKGVLCIGAILPFVIFLSSIGSNKDMGAAVPWRPPYQTYIVGWVLICFCMAISWVFVMRNAQQKMWISLAGFNVIITALALSWVFVYNANKANGIPIFIALISVISAILPVLYSISPTSMGLMLPLVVWGIFQMIVNCAEIAYEQASKEKC